MRTLSLRLVLVVLLLSLTATAVEGQRRARRGGVGPGPRVGAHIGYNFDVDEVLVGGQASWPITPRLDLYPSFDWYFVDPGSLWALNVDLKIRPPTRYGVLYLGGGLSYSHHSNGTSGSDTGLGLDFGLEGRRGRTVPYVEAKLILADKSSFQIVGGFSWR